MGKVDKDWKRQILEGILREMGMQNEEERNQRFRFLSSELRDCRSCTERGGEPTVSVGSATVLGYTLKSRVYLWYIYDGDGCTLFFTGVF